MDQRIARAPLPHRVEQLIGLMLLYACSIHRDGFIQRLKALVGNEVPGLGIIDNLRTLVPHDHEAGRQDREALAQTREAVNGFGVKVVVVHDVDTVYARELRRGGHVDELELAETDDPWERRAASLVAESREALEVAAR